LFFKNRSYCQLLSQNFLRPSNIKSLENIEDFANEKAEKIGSRFIQKIKEFCSKNDLKLDNFEVFEENKSEILMVI
jgi:hypothetical protein